MAAKNDITGDSIQTRGPSKSYADNYDSIFGVRCLKCKFKQNMDLEPPVIICQSCGEILWKNVTLVNTYEKLV